MKTGKHSVQSLCATPVSVRRNSPVMRRLQISQMMIVVMQPLPFHVDQPGRLCCSCDHLLDIEEPVAGPASEAKAFSLSMPRYKLLHLYQLGLVGWGLNANHAGYFRVIQVLQCCRKRGILAASRRPHPLIDDFK